MDGTYLARSQTVFNINHDRVIFAHLNGWAGKEPIDHLNGPLEPVGRDALLSQTIRAVSWTMETSSTERGISLQSKIVFTQHGLVALIRAIPQTWMRPVVL